MKEYLTIKEFSDLSGIETTTLRYWDEIGLFSPVKRDNENNYRYYSPEQMIAVNFINVLRSLHVPLKTIGETQERTPEKIIRLIEQQEKFLDMEMYRLRQCYSVIHARLEMMNYGTNMVNGIYLKNGRIVGRNAASNTVYTDISKISIQYLDESAYILGPQNVFTEEEGFYEPFMNFCNKANELRVNLNFPIGALHENMESFLSSPEKPAYFISMDPTGNVIRKQGNYLVGFVLGYYGQFGDLPGRMQRCIEENSLTVSGPVYTTYLHDEVCEKDPSKYLAQVIVAISRSHTKTAPRHDR